MIYGSRQVEFTDVEVIRSTPDILVCRVENRVFGIPTRRMLPGTEIAQTGDRGRLVLSKELALNLEMI
jgi:hypothetical protein